MLSGCFILQQMPCRIEFFVDLVNNRSGRRQPETRSENSLSRRSNAKGETIIEPIILRNFFRLSLCSPSQLGQMAKSNPVINEIV